MTLTLQQLKDMKPDTIFATGVAIDGRKGINFDNSGEELRWVACRGGVWDWAIYCDYSSKSEEEVKRMGNKIHNDATIKMLVPCDKEAFEMYRH